MEMKAQNRTAADGQPSHERSWPSGDRAAELRMDQTQPIVEELKREGGVIETHADGTGGITISLRWPRTARQPVAGRGHSFPAALANLLQAIG